MQLPFRKVRFGSACELSVPMYAACSIQGDESTMQIELTTEPPTTIYVGSYDLPAERPVSIDAWFLQRMEYFFDKCVLPVIGARGGTEELRVSIEQWNDEESAYCVCQGVGMEKASNESGRCWFARLVGFPDAREYFLMDWTGPRSYAVPLVLPIYESFRALAWERESRDGT